MMVRMIVGALTAIIAAASAQACVAPPDHMYLGFRGSIADADWIGRMRVGSIDRNNGNPRATLTLIECLKGDCPENWAISSGIDAVRHHDAPSDGNSYGHRASIFWTTERGYSNWPDCRIHPNLAYNREYLIFGPLDYSVGFENLAAESDLWLEFVRRELVGASPQLPYPIDVMTYFSDARAVVRVGAAWNGHQVVIDQELLVGEPARYLDMAFAVPEVALRHALDPNCQLDWEGRPVFQVNVDFMLVFEFLPTENTVLNTGFSCGDLFDTDSHVSLRAIGQFAGSGVRRFDIVDDVVHFGESTPIENDGSPAREYSLPAIRDLLAD